jgi:hypothetical protein
MRSTVPGRPKKSPRGYHRSDEFDLVTFRNNFEHFGPARRGVLGRTSRKFSSSPGPPRWGRPSERLRFGARGTQVEATPSTNLTRRQLKPSTNHRIASRHRAVRDYFAISLVGATFQCGPLVGIGFLAAIIPRPATGTARAAQPGPVGIFTLGFATVVEHF